MRWNCPHCQELITADIDFEATSKAYVRCAKCDGMALIQRGATLADAARARRLEAEAKKKVESLAAELEARNRELEKKHEELETVLRERTKEIAVSAPMSPMSESIAAIAPPPFNPPASVTLGASATNDPIPTASTSASAVAEIAVANGFDPIVESSTETPSFAYAKPPAFLLRENADASRGFASIDDDATETATEAYDANAPLEDDLSKTILLPRPNRVSSALAKALSSNAAVWMAAGLALASGLYLFREGRNAFRPETETARPSPATENRAPAETMKTTEGAAAKISSRNLVVVRSSRTVLRAQPSADAATVQSVGQSSIFNALEERAGWIRVEGAKVKTSDRSAWLPSDSVARLPN